MKRTAKEIAIDVIFAAALGLAFGVTFAMYF